MKQKFILSAIFTFAVFITSWAQISIGTNTPDPSAQFEVASANKGFLPPRIALTATNSASPVNNPVAGLIVFNTATAGSYPNNVVPGYYYWDGTSWFAVVSKGNASGDMQYWNGTRWATIPVGTNGSFLTLTNGIPSWGSKEQILVDKIWRVDRLHHVINNVFSSYTFGGANSTGITYDNIRFKFNANGTGTYTDQFAVTYALTWQFPTVDKRSLSLTVYVPTTTSYTWEMLEIAGNYLHASTNLVISGNPNNIETIRLVQIQ